CRWSWLTSGSATISSGEKHPMKAFTEKQRQWVWFAVLWCGGLIAVFLLSYMVRWLIKIT
ncbi:MAG: hypothetical protein P8X80_00405, partial [Desulfobacterales bacterium]